MLGAPKSISRDLALAEFELFRDHISSHAGIFLDVDKADSLRISLMARAAVRGCLDLSAYHALLCGDDVELNELLNLVTINETSFFRFPAQFEALRTTVIEDVLACKPRASRVIRAWSAGCSTGEEPYSIAMTLLDSDAAAAGYRIEVLGTDVSTQALDKGREAVYSARALRGLDEGIVQRFFEPHAGSFRVVRHVRSCVDLGYHNLIKEPYPFSLLGNWDLIFCRNVTIYFQIESIRRVVDNFYDSLNPGGYLFIGHSETLTGISERFETVELDGVFVYRKPGERHTRARAASHTRETATTTPEAAAPVETHPVWRRSGKTRDAQGQQHRATSQAPAPVESAPSSKEISAAHGVKEPMSEQSRSSLATGTPAVVAPPTRGARRSGGRSSTEDELVAGLLAQAHQALDEGSPQEALNLARAALRSDSVNLEAYLICAYAHADGGDFPAAVAECHHALAQDPLDAAARYILGVIYQRLEEPARAVQEFRRTLYVDPDFVLAHFGLANLFRARRAYSDAAREYQMALRTISYNPEGTWTRFMGGFPPDLLVKTCERGLADCRKAMGDG